MTSKFLFVAAMLSFTIVISTGQARATCVGGAENGIEEAGEYCDDGPGICCQADCTPNAANVGLVCDDFNDCTKANTSTCSTDGDCGGGNSNGGAACFVQNGVGQFVDCVARTCHGKVCSDDPTNICEDGNACTGDLCGCTAATPCANRPTTADCTTHPNVGDGGMCDLDANLCTVDQCTAGVCYYTGTTITCAPSAYECKTNDCNPDTGACQYNNRPKGYPCSSDGNQCTDDECGRYGSCKHYARTGASCDDGNVCTSGETCNRYKNCVNGYATVGAPCNDTNICTSSSQCDASATCVGTVCASGNCGSCNGVCTTSLPSCGCTGGSGG